MKYHTCLFLCCLVIVGIRSSNAQIYIDSLNNVGVGTSSFTGTKQFLSNTTEGTSLHVNNTFSGSVAGKIRDLQQRVEVRR